MHIQLPGRFRQIQVIFKKRPYNIQSLPINHIQRFPIENLFDKHLTNFLRKLINQPSNPKLPIPEHIPFGIKNLPDLQRHPRFLICVREITNPICYITICNPRLRHSLSTKHIHQHMRRSLQILIRLCRDKFPHDNDPPIIHRRNKIMCPRRKNIPDHSQRMLIPGLPRLDEKDSALTGRRNM